MKKYYFLLATLLITFSLFAQPANDDCASAENITVTTNTTTIAFEIGTATNNNEIGCDGSPAADYVDIWYDFTMPFNGNVYVNAKIGWNNMALYDACGGTQIQCGSANEFIRGLTSGTNYKLRIFRTAANAGNNYLDFTIKAFEAAANNECASSQNIAVNTTTTTIDFEIGSSTVTNQIGCDGTTSEDYVDLWYDFTMPFNGNINVNAKIAWNNVALYDACAGTQIQCGNSNEFITGLTSGTNYKLRIFRTAANAANNYLDFTIKAFEDAANDDCASSQNIPISTTTTTIDFAIGGATSNNEIGCDGTTAEDYIDIWYDFTMPFNGNVNINAKIGWNNLALYDACSGTQIKCASGNAFIPGLNSGTNYKLRIFRTAADVNKNYLDFSIKAFEDATNNDCTSSQNIPISTTNTTTDFEIGGSTITNQIGCDGTTPAEYVDLWYDFTMPFNGNVYVNAVIGWNKIALYDACGGTQIKCGSGSELVTELTSGTNYKLRIFRTAADTDKNYLDFSIIAYEEATNDDCASAENITVTTDQSTIDFNIGGASINNESGCDGTIADYVDIWYDFTMPVHGNLYVDASIGWTNIALFDACGGAQIQCGSGNQLFTGLTSGTNYKLRLFRTVDLADNTYLSFKIQAFEIINNDDCASAENLTVTNTPTTVNFGIAGATINNEVGCSGSPAEDYADIWYEFTMPLNGSIVIDGTSLWNNFALYDACAGTELGCFGDSGNFGGLTSGPVYKLRVFRTLNTADNQSYKSFSIYSTPNLGLNNKNTGNTIGIYPNPAENFIQIESGYLVNNVSIYDLWGKKVLYAKETNRINISRLNSGIYIVKIKTNKGERTEKIIKI